jgi:hypothetical protein
MGFFLVPDENQTTEFINSSERKKKKELADVFQEHDETETGRIRWNPSIHQRGTNKGKLKLERFSHRETESRRQRRERVRHRRKALPAAREQADLSRATPRKEARALTYIPMLLAR